MRNRRTFIRCCMGYGCVLASGGLRAQGFPTSRSLDPFPGSDVNGCGFGEGTSSPDPRKYLNSSGISELDRGFDLERPLLNRTFHVSPDFTFYDDGSDPSARTEKLPRGSRVFFGINLVAHERDHSPAYWETSVIGILAHEWAHAMQFASGLQELKFIQELHADYMAGWYIGIKNKIVYPEAFANSLYEKGAVNTTGFFNPDAYGSPDQRVRAMLIGFKEGKAIADSNAYADVDSAANHGYSFVASIERSSR